MPHQPTRATKAMRRPGWMGLRLDSELGALIGSAGHLEIAARGRPAAGAQGPGAHEEITVDLP